MKMETRDKNIGLNKNDYSEKLNKIWEYTVIVAKFIKNILEKMGVKFAPWNVPWERRYQTLAAAGWIYLTVFGEILFLILTVFVIRTSYYWIAIIYIILIANQRNSSNFGLKRWTWVRNWKWWTYLQKYFPIELVKTVDLDPDRNYLFCVFPHGVLSTGCFVNFCTNATNFEKVFPGMKSFMATLQGHFLMPLFRELIMWSGFVASTHESLDYMLNKKNGTGRCTALVVGGAAESLNCHNGQYRVILNRRKGFIKVAMRNGAPLVPVFSFGENELYEQPSNPEGSFFRHFQDWIRETTGIAPVMPLGRGLFQYSIGIIPQRRKVVTVVGTPIEVKRNCDPTEEEVNELHAKFTKSLVELFENGKNKYLSHIENPVLTIE